MPALPLVVKPVAPLVIGPAPVLPPILAGREKPLRREDVPLGSVVGLATPVVRVPVPAPSGALPVLPAVAVPRPARELPAEVPTLVEAVDAYVGEPREPAEPYRAPGWLRLAPSWATAEAQPEPVSEPPSFLPPELRTKPPEPPPRMEEGVQSPELPSKPMRKRRPNLGASRRLGLGAPIPKPDMAVDGEALVHPEPPPAAVEPVPEPEPEEPEPGPSAPVYRARPPSPPAPPAKELPRAIVVPPELAHAVRTTQQVDVSAVPVYRGSTVDKAARVKGARAFAAGGAVFLPDAAGSVDTPSTRGLLAHELVHAVQQRTLGTHLPTPDSPLGAELEAEAQAAERYYGGEAGAPEPPPLIHAPSRHQTAAPDLAAPAQHATTTVPPRPATPLQSPFDPTTRAEVGKIAEESAKHVVAEWKNPALHTPTTDTAKQPTGPKFDRVTRKQQLVAETLENVNYERLRDGKAPLTVLDDVQLRQIERRLDREAGGAATAGGGDSLVPPRKHFAPGSVNSVLQGLTGHDPTRDLGLSGMTTPVGSEESWFASKNERPFKERLLGGLGMAGFTEQFKPGNWFEKEPEKKPATPAQPASAKTATAATAATVKKTERTHKGDIDVDRLDLDVLAERIYDRLRRRLRLELLVDRERAGLLTDFR